MNLLLSFREWLEIDEATFHFGQYKGKDITDPSIPVNYLQWALGNLNQLRPDFRKELDQEVKRRQVSKVPAATQPMFNYGKYNGKSINDPSIPGGYIRWTLDNHSNLQPDFRKALEQELKRRQSGGRPTATPKPQIPKPQTPAEPEPQTEPETAVPISKPSEGRLKVLPDELLDKGAPPGGKTEARRIDDQFKQNLDSPGQSHIMINALAGSGKTTMLRHLAWKYGKPGQKWLYLVFNTKNRVEAKEDFPSFVDVQTTNSFLGHLLNDPKNINVLPQTDLMAKMKGGEDDSKITEKSRVIADSPQFSQLIRKAGIPDAETAAKAGQDQYEQTALKGIINSINYTFKETTLTLLGLAKSFAIDPRNENTLKAGLEKILDSYDLDTVMGDVKERIQKYKPYFGTKIKDALYRLMGYDFMQKDYKEEITAATIWMLHETLPNNTNIKHTKGGTTFDLAQFRDFNDDLWFAALHANELNWPRYNVVLADEVQDFNEAQKIMLQKLHDAGAKIVAVGDPNQSLYRFRGADSKAFDNLGTMLGNLSQNKNAIHTLTKNYRSKKNIIDYANRATKVKNLVQGKESPDEGKVTEGEVKYGESFDKLQQEKNAGKIMETAYIARTNEPLVHAALSLLGRGIPFVIVGRDVANDLIKHIGRIMRTAKINDNSSVTQLRDNLQSHLESEKNKYGTHATKKNYLKELDDTTLALVSAIHQFDPAIDPENPEPTQQYQQSTVGKFKDWLRNKLGGFDVQDNEQDLKAYKEKVKKENPVVLTTAHKAKGLEFERVYILRNDQFPHPRAKRPEDLDQEENARFVAYTRPKSELHILDLKGQPGTRE